MYKELRRHLAALGFNKSEIKVYLALMQLGEAPASHIAKKANLPRTTGISILDKLVEEQLVTVHKYRGTKSYWIESPEVLHEMFEAKASIAKEMQEMFSDMYRSESQFPHSEFHATKKSIRRFIEKIVANTRKKSIIYTIDSPHEGNYSKVYSEVIEKSLLGLKKKRSIHTRTLVPKGSLSSVPKERIEGQNITIKEMPASINFTGSLWIIEGTLVHFSGNPPCLVSCTHESIVHGTKQLYDFLWEISETPS